MEAVNVIDQAILDNKESLTNVAVGGKQFKEIQRPDIIRRMPYSKSRVYFTPDRLFFGVTKVAHKLADINNENEFLDKWKEETVDSQEIAYEASCLGTLLHIITAEVGTAIAEKRDVEFNEQFFKHMDRYISDCGLSLKIRSEWSRKIINAIKCIEWFYKTYEIEPIAFEFCVADEFSNIATPLDLIAYATIGGVRKLCNFNFKFRKSAEAFDSDKYQLNMEKFIFNKYMKGVMEIEHTFVVVPKWNAKKLFNCEVKAMDNLYTEKEYEADINYLKTKSGWNSHFNPDLDKMYIPIMGVRAGFNSMQESSKITYRDFLNSFKK